MRLLRVGFVLLAAISIMGCVAAPIQSENFSNIESKKFDGHWTAFALLVREEDANEGLCIKEGKINFDIKNGQVVDGISVNPKYVAERGPGVMSFWGRVTKDGLLTGHFKGGYVVGKWIAILAEDESSVGVTEPVMGMTSEPYQCVTKLVMSRNKNISNLKNSSLLGGEQSQQFNNESVERLTVGDIENRLE